MNPNFGIAVKQLKLLIYGEISVESDKTNIYARHILLCRTSKFIQRMREKNYSATAG